MQSARQNNLDFIRFCAATAVIFGHAYPLNQLGSPGFLANSVQTISVKIFFCLSGVLITQSWLKDPHLFRYLARRVLRIFPALALVLVVLVFVLGPSVTTLPLAEYFTNPRTWHYLGNNLSLDIVYDLPGVFAMNPYPNAVNGSLWSLPVEFLMYLVVPVVFVARGERLRRVAGVVGCVALVSASLYLLHVRATPPGFVAYGMSLSSVLDVTPYFAIGSMIAALGWTRVFDAQHAAVALLLAILFQVPHALVSELMLMVLVPVATLGLGYAAAPRLGRFGSRGDFSYGIYLWGWPAQQTVVLFVGHAMTPLLNAALAAPLAIGCAVVSWRLVERRALGFRPGAGKVASPALTEPTQNVPT